MIKKRMISLSMAVFVLSVMYMIICTCNHGVTASAAATGSERSGKLLWSYEEDDFAVSIYNTGIVYIDGTGNLSGDITYKILEYINNEDEEYDISSIIVGEGITSLGYKCFGGFGFRSVELPHSLKSIDKYVFDNCNNLESVVVPDSVEYIGEYALGNCASLRTVKLPAGLRIISQSLFIADSKLERVELPDSVVSIENDAFRGCSYLSEINIPDGVVYIGDYAFYGNTSLKKITIPAGVTCIRREVFNGNSKLNSIYFKGNCPDFDYNCFNGVKAVLYYPANDSSWNNITQLVNNDRTQTHSISCVSYNVTPVTTAKPENTDTYLVDSGVCSDWQNEDGYTWKLYSDGVLKLTGGGKLTRGHQWQEDQKLEWYEKYVPDIRKIIISEGIEEIDDRTFWNFYMVTDVQLPSTLNTIGTQAFLACNSLVNIDIPEGVNNIQYGAFQRCSHLKNITLPPGITEIPDYCFNDCDRLYDITLPEGITKIGKGAFLNCPDIKTLVIPESVVYLGNDALNMTTGNALGDIIFRGRAPEHMGKNIRVRNIYYPASESESWEAVRLELDNNIGMIPYNEGEDPVNTHNTPLPVAVNTPLPVAVNTPVPSPDASTYKDVLIDEYECDGLLFRLYGNGDENAAYITYVSGDGIIKREPCERLYSQSWKTVHYDEYSSSTWNCLCRVVIGEGIKVIDENAFYNFNNIREVVLPDSLTEIRQGAFSFVSALQYIVIPDGVSDLGENAFYGCKGLESIELSDNITAIRDNTFNDCRYLQYIKIPSSVVSVYVSAFNEMSARIIFNSEAPDFHGNYDITTESVFYYPAQYRESWISAKKSVLDNITIIPYNEDEDPVHDNLHPEPTQVPTQKPTQVPTQTDAAKQTNISSASDNNSQPIGTFAQDSDGQPVSITDNRTESGTINNEADNSKGSGGREDKNNVKKNKNTLIKPTFRLKKGYTNLGERCVIITLKKYEGNYIEIYLHKGKKRVTVKLKKSKTNIKKNKARFKLTYRINNTVYKLSVRTYKTVKNKKCYSPYSVIKQIKV